MKRKREGKGVGGGGADKNWNEMGKNKQILPLAACNQREQRAAKVKLRVKRLEIREKMRP